MTIVLGVLFAAALAASTLLILAILLQEPRTGGLGAGLGSAGREVVGSGSLSKFVAIVGAVWIALCLAHALAQPAAGGIQAATLPTQESPLR